MKHIVRFSIIVVGFTGVLLSCSSIPEMPDWALEIPESKDSLYAVGDAKMSSLSLSRTMAASRARDEIARQVSLYVKTAITDYAQDAGEGNNTQAVEFVESVSRQVTEATLNGTKIVNSYVARDGTVYALVEYPIAQLRAVTASTFERNEAAQFAKFEADQALEYIDKELDSR